MHGPATSPARLDTSIAERLFAGPSEMHARCRALDWAATPLGPVERWSPALRVAAQAVLAAGLPNILLWGRELTQLYNDSYARIIRAKHPLALGRGNQEVWPEVWHLNGPIYERVFAGETVTLEDAHYPLERERADAPGEWSLEEAYLTISFSPVRDEDGAVAGVLANMIETTSRVRERGLADALRASEARFREMADAAPVMLWVTEADGRCSFLNRAWEEFTGQAMADGVGMGWLDVVHPDDVAETARIFLDASAHGAPFRLEYRLRRHDGVYRRAVDAGAPRLGASGQLLGYVGSVVDIEERAALLDTAQAAQAAAEQANRAKSDFLAVMSHELRTPLNAIGGYAELLEMGLRGALTPPQREDVVRIQRAQRHLLGLINEVLNYARLESGAVLYDLVPVPARDALAAAESLVAPQAASRGIALAVDECPSTLVVRADADKLRQVLVNLLSNAVKFTNAGGRVSLGCTRVGAMAHFTVRDTGIGIATEQRARIFEPFVQVRADLTRPHDGTGLGLAISRDLARGMGGDLTVESEPGVGSTFTVALPCEDARA